MINCNKIVSATTLRSIRNDAEILFSYTCAFILYARRNLFLILLNEIEIKLYLTISNWFRTKRISVWFQIARCYKIHSENGKYNLISVIFNKIKKRFFCPYKVIWRFQEICRNSLNTWYLFVHIKLWQVSDN